MDLWKNNLIFSRGEKPELVAIVDWQEATIGESRRNGLLKLPHKRQCIHLECRKKLTKIMTTVCRVQHDITFTSGNPLIDLASVVAFNMKPVDRCCFRLLETLGFKLHYLEPEIDFRRTHEVAILQHYLDGIQRRSHLFKREFPLESAEKVSEGVFQLKNNKIRI